MVGLIKTLAYDGITMVLHFIVPPIAKIEEPQKDVKSALNSQLRKAVSSKLTLTSYKRLDYD